MKRSEAAVGAVLAGGRSRRMGRDKALLVVGGRTLLEHAVRVLRQVLEHVVVVAPARVRYDESGAEVVPDIRPGLGPVGGLYTALALAGGRSVFLLACDMPSVDAQIVRWILDAAAARAGEAGSSPSVQATVVEEGGQVQPLCGLYDGSCVTEVEKALEQNRLSAVELLEVLVTDRVRPDRNAPWYRPGLFANINSREDLARWQRQQEGVS